MACVAGRLVGGRGRGGGGAGVVGGGIEVVHCYFKGSVAVWMFGVVGFRFGRWQWVF